ncbi:hypothetical protein CEXT_312831 [Caerostris extrusa]|uniref:Uncharacterized protein n=1 Tax=Caerostris extrusa TaxID=172846 RepID=A0AAV4S6E0_CAEEX|nr:hypothetical protein CEXT_312831 [Caerostris extrusa]
MIDKKIPNDRRQEPQNDRAESYRDERPGDDVASDPRAGALYLLARPVMLHGVRAGFLGMWRVALTGPLIRVGSLRA